MVQFPGFTRHDFEIFTIPEFHERMFHIRTQIRPKLAMLGDDVAPGLSAIVGHPMYPHTASHARRRVNPPDDTWVAFARSARGYKRYAHFEVGIDVSQVFIRFVVKPEGEEDKLLLLEYLRREGLDALRLEDPEPIAWYRDDHGRGRELLSRLDSERFDEILHLTAKKSHGFALGVSLSRDSAAVGSAQLVPKSLNVLTHLAPLYQGVLAAAVSGVHD